MRKPSAATVVQLVALALGVWITYSTARELVALHASTGLMLICLLSTAGVFMFAASDAPRIVSVFRRSEQFPQD